MKSLSKIWRLLTTIWRKNYLAEKHKELQSIVLRFCQSQVILFTSFKVNSFLTSLLQFFSFLWYYFFQERLQMVPSTKQPIDVKTKSSTFLVIVAKLFQWFAQTMADFPSPSVTNMASRIGVSIVCHQGRLGYCRQSKWEFH